MTSFPLLRRRLLSACGALALTTLLALPAAAQATKSNRPAPAKKPAATPAPTSAAAKPAVISPEERARQMTAKMQSALNLQPQQVPKVQEINLRCIKNVEEARVTYINNLRRMAQEIDLIGQSRLSLLKDVLSDQQFQAYNALRAQKMGVPGERGAGSGGAAGSGVQLPAGAE